MPQYCFGTYKYIVPLTLLVSLLSLVGAVFSVLVIGVKSFVHHGKELVIVLQTSEALKCVM